MKKLTLEHLAGYLPYSVRFIECWEPSFTNQPDIINNRIMNISNINILLVTKRYKFKYAKPILRPLSDLTKEIEVGGEKFVPLRWLNEEAMGIEKYHIFIDSENETKLLCDFLKSRNVLTILAIQKLYSWHFDIHNLISEGLAIDINTI